jgi:hypothetical protein
VQPITVPQINSRHANALPAVVAAVVCFDLADPVVPDVLRHIGAEANVDQEVTVRLARHEVRRCCRRAEFLVDALPEKVGRLPAAEGAGALGLVVERCAEGDYSKDLWEFMYVVSWLVGY